MDEIPAQADETILMELNGVQKVQKDDNAVSDIQLEDDNDEIKENIDYLRKQIRSDIVDEDCKKLLTVEFMLKDVAYMTSDDDDADDEDMTFLEFACKKRAKRTVEYVMKIFNSYVLKHKPDDSEDYEWGTLYDKIIDETDDALDYIVEHLKKCMKNDDNDDENSGESNDEQEEVSEHTVDTLENKDYEEKEKVINMEDSVRKIRMKYANNLKSADSFLDIVFPILTCPFTNGSYEPILLCFIEKVEDPNIEDCLLLELTLDKIILSTDLSTDQIHSLLATVDSDGISPIHSIASFLADYADDEGESDDDERDEGESDDDDERDEGKSEQNTNKELEICEIILENIWTKCTAVVDPNLIGDQDLYFDMFGAYCKGKLPKSMQRLIPANVIPENKTNSEVCNKNTYEYETQMKFLSKQSEHKMNFLHRNCTYLCLRKLNEKLHPEVFSTLLHEKYNGSNCLHLIVSDSDFCLEECDCDKDSDKTRLDCDIEFIMEHFKICTSSQCLSLSELNPDGKTFSQLLDSDTLFGLIKRLRGSKLSIDQLIALLDNTCLVDRHEASYYIERKFKSTETDKTKKKETKSESAVDDQTEKIKKNYKQTMRACINVFRLQNPTLSKNLVSSTFVECFKHKDSSNDAILELTKNVKEKIIQNDILELITDDDKFKEETDLSLLYIALVAERYKICELLLITEQINVIPNCLRVMLFCQYKKMIGDGKQNNDIDRLQDFCQTVLHNAFGELFRSVTNEQEIMLFQYIHGTMECGDDSGKLIKGPLFKPFLTDGNQDRRQRSILQMAEDVNTLAEMYSGTDDDTKFRRMFTLSSFTKLLHWLWSGHKTNKKAIGDSQESNENIYGRKMHFGVKIAIDLLFLSIYTIYLLTGIYDNRPFQKPWDNFTNYWSHENDKEVLYFYQLFYVFQSNFSVLLELLLVTYWIGMIIEEVKEVKWLTSTCRGLHPNLLKTYGWRLWLNVWNLADVFYIIMFGLFIGMRIAFYITRNQDDIYISRYAPLRTHFISMFWIRIIAGLAYLSVCFRRMHSICMIFKSMGVLYITFQQLITKDMRPFLTMLAINIFSFGVFFQVLLNPGNLSFFPNGTIDQHKLISLLDVYARPMMVAFGEYGLDDIGKCFSLDTLGDRARRAFPTIEFREMDECTHPAGSFLYAYLAIFIYMLIVNLTLFNLLIARFSLTVTRYNEEAVSMYYWYLYLEWKQLASSRKVDTSPVNIFYVIIDCITKFCCMITCCCCKKQIKDISTEQKIFKKSDEYLHFLIFQANAFSDKRDTFTNPIYETAKEVDSAVLKLQTSLNQQLDDMENSINKKHEKETSVIKHTLKKMDKKSTKRFDSMEQRFDKFESLLQTIVEKHFHTIDDNTESQA